MTDAWVSLLVACVPALFSLIGVLAANRKTTALLTYRLEQLERKMDKHNNMIERVYALEGRMTEAEHNLRDLNTGRAS